MKGHVTEIMKTNRIGLLTSLFLAAIAGQMPALHGQADPLLRHAMIDVEAFPETEAFRPTPLPDRICLTWNDNPATTQAVTWQTDTSVERAFGEIAKTSDGPLFWHRTLWAGRPELLETNLGKSHYHSVVFRDLEPATGYMYRVGDGINWSPWLEFRTASDQREPFTFVYFGDAQEDNRSQWSRVIRRAFRDVPNARFFLHAGDLVDHAHNDGEWAEWFEAQGFICAMVPILATPGNHEYSGGKLSMQWRPQFTFPENGPEDHKETVYYVDYQGVRIISLDSSAFRTPSGKGQTEWLEEVLKDNTANWTIVTFHHPVFASQPGRDNPLIREGWKPLFDRYKVDLVLQGHDHSYFRTGANSREYQYEGGVDRYDPESGTVYVVSHSGSKTRQLDRQDWMARAGEDLQLFQILHVEKDEIRYESRTAAGRIYDAFTLRKQPGGVKKIVEQVPEGVEEVLRGEESILPSTLTPWFYHQQRFPEPSRR